MHYSLPSLASSLANGQLPESCHRVDDDTFHHDEVDTRGRETLDHWMRVEAGVVAGACPTRLRSFFASLARLGYGTIASRVAAQLARMGIAIQTQVLRHICLIWVPPRVTPRSS